MNKPDIMAAIHRALDGLAGCRSVTFVGSFVDRDDPSGISDIDIVVVVDRLTPEILEEAIGRVAGLTGRELGRPGWTVRVNATFGPLKFDDQGQIVVHLMLYDTVSHRAHVLNSPFTCLDWERSGSRCGQSLADIYPVGRLSPRQFTAARRGLADYLSDLASCSISYRELTNANGTLVETRRQAALDPRHQGEYAYHIIRNLIANALKMLTGENRMWAEAELLHQWQSHMGELAAYQPTYERLRDAKFSRRFDYPADAISHARGFVSAFGSWLDALMAESLTLTLYRHAPTAMNDGSFLGTARDPGVIDAAAIVPLAPSPSVMHTSPLRRARETAAALTPSMPLAVDERLREIAYGAAEGLRLADLHERFPNLVAAWHRGDDARFPDGESYLDVQMRAKAFLGSLPDGPGAHAAVTHNVVLRALVADVLGLPLSRAHRITIPHTTPIAFRRIRGRWVADWDSSLQATLVDSFVGIAV